MALGRRLGPRRPRDHHRRRRRRGAHRAGDPAPELGRGRLRSPRSTCSARSFGALFFGRLSDALGRKNLFIVTLGVYLAGNALTALTWGNGAWLVAFLYLTRFIAGMGIGGEYAAINSAIDEMMPARYRGRVDIAVNGTYWAGAIIGTLRHAASCSTTCRRTSAGGWAS